MSVTGQIFTNQQLTAAQHRNILTKLFNDGIINGCNVTYTGYELSIASGIFITAGGIQSVLTAETFTFELTYGYARVISEIDLTKSSTDNVWNQHQWIIEYAASASEFNPLVQENINTGNGTKYQVEFAVVQLSASGISSIVRKIGNA